MDSIQTFLIIIIVVLTLLMFVVGIQVFLMIADMRSVLKKINIILEDALVGGGLINSSKLMGIFSLFRNNKKIDLLSDNSHTSEEVKDNNHA